MPVLDLVAVVNRSNCNCRLTACLPSVYDGGPDGPSHVARVAALLAASSVETHLAAALGSTAAASSCSVVGSNNRPCTVRNRGRVACAVCDSAGRTWLVALREPSRLANNNQQERYYDGEITCVSVSDAAIIGLGAAFMVAGTLVLGRQQHERGMDLVAMDSRLDGDESVLRVDMDAATQTYCMWFLKHAFCIGLRLLAELRDLPTVATEFCESDTDLGDAPWAWYVYVAGTARCLRRSQAGNELDAAALGVYQLLALAKRKHRQPLQNDDGIEKGVKETVEEEVEKTEKKLYLGGGKTAARARIHDQSPIIVVTVKLEDGVGAGGGEDEDEEEQEQDLLKWEEMLKEAKNV